MGNIVIAMSTDDNYSDATCLAMEMIMSHAEIDDAYVFYILSKRDDLSIENKAIISNVANKYCNATVSHINVEQAISKSNINNYISQATYYRLYLPDLIRDDKCLYLDQDILVRSDIKELYEKELGDNYLAGVSEYQLPRNNDPEIVDTYHIRNTESYINAGVLLLNLKILREVQFTNQVDELINYNFALGDQDILNIIARGRITYLLPKYNYYTSNNLGNVDDPIIVHYSCKNKPWNDISMRYLDEWWEACIKSSVAQNFITRAGCLVEIRKENQEITSTDDLLNVIRDEEVIIYGAGKIASRAIPFMKDYGVNIIGIAVSNMDNQPTEVEGFCVKSIDEYTDKDARVLICMADVVYELCEHLIQIGFSKINRINHLFA